MENNGERAWVLKVNNIGKHFKIYARKRDRLKQLIKGRDREYFKKKHALKEVSFILNRGETIGIVGRNGCGKSTLLQIVAGTMHASNGYIEVKSGVKIAALLELGSGFSPEFTGRENIYLNATVHGLSKKDIDKRIIDIINFADIGEYIDQPVSTYSSGMVVRVAFAILTNIEADILIIDEALAVGDTFFTQKCLRFIQRFKKHGSILFVSHDAGAVMSLCDRAILVENGEQIMIGNPKEVIEKYTQTQMEESVLNIETGVNSEENDTTELNRENDMTIYKEKWKDYRTNAIEKCEKVYSVVKNAGAYDEDKETFGGQLAKIIEVSLEVLYRKEKTETIVEGGELVKISIKCEVYSYIESIMIGFIVKSNTGLTLFGDNTENSGNTKTSLNSKPGDILNAEFIFTIPLLPAGDYSVTTSIAEGSNEQHKILHWLNDSAIIKSHSNSVAAGLAGVAMQSVRMYKRTS